MKLGSQLRDRLAIELKDETLAATIVEALDDRFIGQLDQLAEGHVAGSPALTYSPTFAADETITSIWAFSYGYRLGAGVPQPERGTIPTMDQLQPGPTNDELARQVAMFVQRRQVPVVAQWEIARTLRTLEVDDVTSVEPDFAADGSIIYLSTAGVIEKGLQLAATTGINVNHVGVVGHHDHVARCVATARSAGLTADVPEGVVLPSQFDAGSGQPWTRDRATWIVNDLRARVRAAAKS